MKVYVAKNTFNSDGFIVVEGQMFLNDCPKPNDTIGSYFGYNVENYYYVYEIELKKISE